MYICKKVFMKRNFSFTALISKTSDGWYYGRIEEVPEAMSQGRSLEELEDNLQDALAMMLQIRREEATREMQGKKFIRRKLLPA
jgi:predicted RNase H-like HicB family nuclease